MKLLILLLFSALGTISISAQTNKPVIGSGVIYEKRTDVLNAPDCNGSEAYIKKKVKAQLANYYKEYPWIAVDITSFKGQNGYTDKADATKIVYPYKIELLVHLKRPTTKDGKDATELCTWKYDAVYEYATKPGKKCEFNLVPSQKILVKRQVY